MIGDRVKVLVQASWLVLAGVHTCFVSAVTLLQGLSECLVWVLHHVESCGVGGVGGTGAKHGGSPENGGGWEQSSGLQGKPGRNGSTFQTMKQPSSGLNPGVLGLGRMRWENSSLVLRRFSPNVRPRSSGEGCTESGAASGQQPGRPMCQGRRWCQGLARGPGEALGWAWVSE